jgi:hypothetical protein
VAVTVSIFLLAIKAANTLVMDNSEQIGFQLAYLPQKILLRLCWRSVSECGCYRTAVSFAYKGCQSVDYELQQANHFPIKLLTYPKIMDARLMFILKLGCSPVYSTVLSDGWGRHAVRKLARMDGTPTQPSVQSEHKNDGRTADVWRGRYFDCSGTSSTVPGSHWAVTIYT